MNDGWEFVRVGDIAVVFDGPHATPKKTEVGPWYLSISSLADGRLDLSKSAHLSAAEYERWTKRVRPLPGDTLFSYETRLGEAAHWLLDEPAALGRRMGLLRPKASVDPRYLTYAYLAPQFQGEIARRTVRGATVDRLPIADIGNWPILLPPLEEQRRIAGALASIEDLIKIDDDLASAIEHLLRHEFETRRFDSAGPRTLGDLIDINPHYPRPPDPAPYIDMTALPTSGSGIVDVSERAPIGGARFMNGDTLLARITPCLENGKTAFVDCLAPGTVGVGSTEFIVMRARQGYPQSWPYFLARSPRFREYAIRHMTGTSGRQRTSAESVAAYPIVDPGAPSLDDFGRLADPLIGSLARLREESATAKRTLAELVPLLLSGAINSRDMPAA